jgi:oxygen-dependent protoporphyrinogen oxidase
MAQDERRVAIVGGGISGLAAAQRLTALAPGLDVALFEAGHRLGGMLQTEHVGEFCLELGPDSMLRRLPWGVDLCREIGLGDELVPTSTAPAGIHVVRRGQLMRMPDGLAVMAPRRIWPILATPILSWPGKLRLAAEAFLPPRRSDEDESLADFCRRRLGREAFERLVQPLASGIYMGDPERLGMQAAFPQFAEMERQHGGLIRGAWRTKGERANGALGGGPEYGLFVAPRRGMGQLVEKLSSRLGRCSLRLNERLTGLRSADRGWLVETAAEAGQPRQEQFAGLILALPAHAAGPLLAPFDRELAGLLTSIPYSGCVAVNLAFRREAVGHPLDSFGFVAPLVEQCPVLACTFSSVKYPDRAPDGAVLLRAFLGGACRPEAVAWPDAQILQTVGDVLRQFLDIRDPPLFSRITRWPQSMPQYEVGHVQRVDRVDELMRRLPCIELAGNAYRGVGIPHCIHSGQQAALRLLTALGIGRP